MTVAPVPPVPRSTGVTVWDRKKPERHPEKEVELPSGLWMPAAEDLDSIVDLARRLHRRSRHRVVPPRQDPWRIFALIRGASATS
jgi:hypothetical protein